MKISYCPNCYSILLLQIAKFTAMVQEKTVIIERICAVSTNLDQFTIFQQGPKVWNSLPVSVTRSLNLFSFKTKM